MTKPIRAEVTVLLAFWVPSLSPPLIIQRIPPYMRYKRAATKATNMATLMANPTRVVADKVLEHRTLKSPSGHRVPLAAKAGATLQNRAVTKLIKGIENIYKAETALQKQPINN